MTTEQKTVAPKKERVKRTPINGARNVLNVRGKDPAYSYRIVNDVDTRVNDFLERGYEVVTDQGVTVGDKRVAIPSQSGSVVEMSVGQGQKAVLMRIKKEWYDEDQAAKQQSVDQIENQMKAETRKDGNYGSIKIES
jgi:hypothetical protein